MKQKIKQYFLENMAPYILQLFVRLIYFTNKKRFHYTNNIKEDENIIVSMWHGDLLMQPLNYRAFRKNGTVKVIVSEHRDGKLIRKVCEYLGVGGIAGSSSKGGAKALINAIKSLKKGIDVAITPDGPRGPIYSVADGVVALSKKTGAKILPFSSKPSKYWQMKSWDKFIVPKPFGEIDFYVGEPFDIKDLSLEDAKELIYKKMMENQLQK
jgi:lysophospholipid acyltransferase (LPLAT)-like uncharacterized protein